MRIDIEQHVHHDNNPVEDHALWAAIGPLLCHRSVHEACGGPIYSVPGVRWFIARSRQREGEPSRVLGFASLRPTPSALWYDYGYVVPDVRGRGVFTKIAEARDAAALELAPTIHTRTVIRKDRWKHYKSRGWTIQSRRGSWIHAVRGADAGRNTP